MQNSETQEIMFAKMIQLPWTQKERYRNGIEGLLDECKDKQQLAAALHILEDLKYCTSEDLEQGGASASDQIQKKWNLDSQDTNIVGVAEPNRTCGSTAFLRAIEIKLPRDWGKNIYTNFVSIFSDEKNMEKKKKNLVIVDDFIGTGNKLQKKIASVKKNEKTKHYEIYVLAFAGMEFGIENVGACIDEKIHSFISLKKSISTVMPEAAALKLTQQMQELEKNIFNEPHPYSFGYQQSEASFYLEASNIPNNNFPILWWEKYADNSERSPLFTRR